MSKKVIIIGAGIGGIATANLLAKAGYSVTVYEKNDQPGGRAGTMSIDGFTFDTGPSWYLMPTVFEQYFSLFGKSAQHELALEKLTPAYKVFFEDHPPVTITGAAATDAATFEAIEPGAGKRLESYIEKGDATYQLALKHFLYTNFSSASDFTKKELLPHAAAMGKLALTPIDKYVGRFVSDTRLKQILEYPMVFLGSSPFSAPALYSLMSALDFKEGVYYPKRGIYAIINALMDISRSLGVTYHYNAPVRHILTDGTKSKGVELADGSIVHSDIVVSNADLHFTETQLLPPELQSYPEQYWQKREAGPSALLMYLGVEGDIPNLEHHNLFFVNDWEDNFKAIFTDKTIPFPASLYICKPSATDPAVAPKGHQNMFVLVPLPAGVEIDNDTLTKLGDQFLQYIETKLEIPNLTKRVIVKELSGPNEFTAKYNSWQGSALGPSHILRQSALFRTPNKSKKVSNLYYVGGFTTPGIGLPMCLISAELVYKRLAGNSKGGPVTRIETIGGDHA